MRRALRIVLGGFRRGRGHEARRRSHIFGDYEVVEIHGLRLREVLLRGFAQLCDSTGGIESRSSSSSSSNIHGGGGIEVGVGSGGGSISSTTPTPTINTATAATTKSSPGGGATEPWETELVRHTRKR